MGHILVGVRNQISRVLAFIVPVVCGAGTAFATLPVTFEENRGQVGSEALFLANTSGYRVFLTRQGAVIVSEDNQVARIRLARSRNPLPVGTHSLIAKTNYLGGSDPSRWIRGIPNYEEVAYPQVYPGIDMTWHANGGEIEHDFLVAPGADPRRIRLTFSGVALRLSPEGDLLAGTIRLRKPRAYQDEREVTCHYALHGSKIGFALGAYDRARPLTIDPTLSFSTYLGGTTDAAAAIALDASGNVYVAGKTKSPNFPVTPNAFQHAAAAGTCPVPEPFGGTAHQACYSIFVAKFSGDGKTLLYATYLGGGGPFDTPATAMAVGQTGAVYVLGAGSFGFPALTPLPGQRATDSFVIALSADGSSLLFGTALPAGATAMAVDAAGAIYLAGSTRTGLPTVNAYQATPGDSSLFRTSDAGNHWKAVTSLPLVSFPTVAVDPSNPQVVYIGGTGQLYKTSDGGEHWSLIPTPIDSRGVPIDVMIDPHSPQTLYLTAPVVSTPYKSVDGGATWTLTGTPGAPVSTLVLDPTNSSALYAITPSALYKSTDGAATWNLTGLVGHPGELVVDPTNGATLYATASAGLQKSTDGGATWSQINQGLAIWAFALDPSSPQTLYASTSNSPFLYKTTDGGAHWNKTTFNAGFAVISLLVDPATPSHVWAATYGGIWVSLDSGNNWSRTLPTYGSAVLSLVTDNAGTIYAAGMGAPGDGFAMKLDPTGSNIQYSTYLGGIGTDSASSIAVDSAGRAYIAGATASPDFPLAAPLQSSFGGGTDAFLTVLDPTGSHLVWSTYLSGSGIPQASAVVVDSAGNVHIAGKTSAAKIKGDGSAVIFSAPMAPGTTTSALAADAAGNTYVAGWTGPNLPVVNAVQPVFGGIADAFVMKLNGQTGAVQCATYLGGSQSDNATGLAVDAAGNAYVAGSTASSDFPLQNSWQGSFSNVFVAKLAVQPATLKGLTNAASYTATVAPGGLVSIFGTALAASPASATQLPLPTRLSGTQVTVNGVAAPLLYASPQQLNAQVPFETQSAPAQVQVTSSEGTMTMTVQVAATAPAIFSLNQQGTGPGAILHGTTYQVVTDSNPATAGEIISIYCTGLGAVNPPAQTGAVPPDPPSQTVNPVQVSIAGVTVQPLYAGVAPGFPGLYQINAQIPAGIQSGTQPLEIVQNGSASNSVTVAVQ